MKINAERLIELIVKRVIEELSNRGVQVEFSEGTPGNGTGKSRGPKVIDMTGYKTPILTEHHVRSLDMQVVEIEVPANTVVTPGAKDIIRQRKLTVRRKQNA